VKGLLLKDWYMIKQYCKIYLVITVLFGAASVVNDENLFFVFYPCVLGGMIPVNLLGYDERSHWDRYSGTLPYTKKQIVSAKYLIGLFVQIAMLLVTGVAQGIKIGISGAFSFGDFAVLMLMMLTMATFSSSITQSKYSSGVSTFSAQAVKLHSISTMANSIAAYLRIINSSLS
jgi:hypothetical protein